ncbi:MAG TPA: hypothetical protein VFU50_15725 [Terriglobales bacterium]|nr:hypothetical protein [Terriglobales bacterium]
MKRTLQSLKRVVLPGTDHEIKISGLTPSYGCKKPPAETRRDGIWLRISLMALVVLGSVVRIIAVFQHNPLEIQTTDPGRWWFTATHLSTLQPIAAIDPFGYQIWLGMIAAVTGGSHTAIAVHNAILSVLTPWIWHRFLRELTGNEDLALTGWAVLCGLPSWISIFSYTMSETLFLPCMGLALWFTIKFFRTRSSIACLACAASWAFASSLRIYALPFAIFLLALGLYRSSQRAIKVGYIVGVFALFIAPLSFRTHRLLNVWDPFGFPEMNRIYMASGKRTLRFDISRDNGAYHWTYEFGSPALYEEPLEPISTWHSSREGIVYFSIDEAHGRADWERAFQASAVSWPHRLLLRGENYVFFNFSPSWPDNNPDRMWDRAAVSMRWMWAPLALLVLLANIYYRDQLAGAEARVFAVLTAAAWALTPLAPAIMEGRYRKPVEGLLLINLLLLIACRRPTEPIEEFDRAEDRQDLLVVT